MGQKTGQRFWERFRQVERKFFVALIASLVFGATAFAQSTQPIVPDGNTKTNLTNNGNVTDITTSTVVGNNGYNSFSVFNVNTGTVVNLYLPTGTDNLLNLVNAQTMKVDVILNSIKNGQIGGNVFFADPFGIVVGKSGVVNVGSFTALTPTQNFMNQFFDSPGNPSAAGTSAILSGTVPINPHGLISVQGTINAIGNIGLYAGAVNNFGVIQSGAVFTSTDSTFSDVVNTNGLQNATSIAVQNGNIVIQTTGTVENAGSIVTNGASNLNAGNVTVQAGGELKLDSGSLVSASGSGKNSNGGNINIIGDGNGTVSSGTVVAANGGDVSGNGGAVDLSAKGTLTVKGGVFSASATDGTAGTVTFDPTNINLSGTIISDGTPINETGDTISVAPGTIISSRYTVLGANQLTGTSIGDSGDINFTAPQITVGDGAYILANVESGSLFAPGNITMTAENSAESSTAVANAGITIGNATIEGGDITLKATSDATANNTLDSVIQTLLNDTNLGFLVNGPAAADTASATSTITVGNPGSAGKAVLNASGDVSINSEATSDVKINIVGAPQGVAYGQSDANATATIGSNATITADKSFDLSAKTTDNLELLSQTGSTTPLNVAVSYGKTDSTTNATVAGNVTAADIKVDTENENKFVTEAKGFNNTGGGAAAAGIGVALGFYKSNATTSVSGSLTATEGGVDISSSSTNDENATRAESEVTDKTDLGKIENMTVPFLGTLSGFIKEHSKTKSESNPNQFGLAAAVSYMSSSNKASTNVSGTVKSDAGAVNIDGTATDNPKISAAGSTDGANLSIGGALALGNFSNEADATVTGSALVTAANDVAVKADAEIPNPVIDPADQLAAAFDFTGVDFSNPVTAGQSLWSDVQTLYGGMTTLQKDVVNPGEFFTSFTNTGLSAEGSKTVGLAGSVDLTTISNTSDAHISGMAQVTSDTGDVKVNATSNATIINVAGMAFSLESVLKLNPGVSGGSSLGGSYAGITLNNSSKAYIGDNTKVKATAGNVKVGSDTETFALDVVQSGDKSEKFGITGAFNWLNLNDTSEAFIQSDATVSAGENVDVNATNNLKDFGITGALGIGGTVQVGVTTSWNQVNDKTLAYIGDPSNSRTSLCTGCGVTAGGDVNVEAKSKENIYAISLAAAKSGSSGEGADGESSSKPTGETAPSNSGSGTQGDNKAGGGQYGFGISANIAFNQINDGSGGPGVTTNAFINNGANVNATGDINLTAQDTSFAVAVGVAATLGQTVSLAGAYSQNTFLKQVEAYTENANLSAKGLSLTATDHGDLFDISAGGGVNTESGVAIAGSVNNNSITNKTEAYLGSGTTATGIGSDGITLKAQEGSASNNDKIVSVAGGVGIGLDGGGIGVGIDLGNYNNTVKASVESGADTGGSGNAQITADTNVFMLPIAVSFGIGSSFGVNGSFAYEQLTNNTTASIDGTLSTDGNLLLASNDASDILIIGGGVGAGGDAGFGVTAVIPSINRTTTASIGDNASVTALGSDSSPLTYDSQTFVGALLDATSSGSLTDFAIEGSGGEAVGVSGAVILNPFFNSGNAANTLNDDTEATIGKNATVNGNNSGAAGDQSVMLEAKDSTSIMDVAGALSIAGEGLSVGIGFDQVLPNWTVNAGIGSGSTVNAADNVIVTSTLDNSLKSFGFAAAGSGGEVSVSGAGAASVLNVTTNTDSYINGNVLAGGNVEVAADRNTGSMNLIDGDAAVAVSLGGGVGASVGKITTNDTVDASIGGTASVTALGNGAALNVPNGQLDSNGDPKTSAFHGVSVTAMSYTSSIPIAAGLAGSGVFAGQGSILINSFTENTKAHVDSGAKVNVTSDGGANSDQSVQALATGDMYLFSTAGAVGVGGGALAAGVDTETLNRTVDAYISGATVNAADNVLVESSMPGSATSLAIAGSVGGFAGDGAVSVVNETTNTKAYIDGSSIVKANGSVAVLANRDTSLTTGDGSIALSGGVSANGSVSTVNKNDTVSAYVGSNTSVTALGQKTGLSVPVDNNGALSTASIAGLTVAATAQETLQTYAVGASISGGVGALSGSTTINNITENTSARIENGATINGNNAGAASGQGVNVLASDKTNLTAVDGALGVAFDVGGGIGAALDFGNIQKTTVAGIDNGASVNALGTVNVDALSSEDINSYEAAVGGSIVAGIAGTTADYWTNPITTTTTAYVGSCTTSCGGGATVNAGSLGVDANDSLTFNTITGELSVGGLALGAATLEVKVNDNTSAYVGADSNISTQSGGVNVNSTFGDSLTGTALAGSGGAVSGNAAFGEIKDNSNNTASIADDANVSSTGNVGVTANTTRNLSVTTGALSAGLAAVGAVISETTTGGSTDATIGNSVTLSAKNLNLSADANDTATSKGYAVTGGIGAGQYNQASADLGGSVTAAIGDNAVISTTHDLTVAASGESKSYAKVFGVNVGGITVGVARSEASATPTVKASIGNNGDISAGHDLTLKATYTSNGVTADGVMSSGSLANVGVTTSYSHANNSPTVSAVVGDSNNSGSTLSAVHDLTISSTSNADAKASFNGNAFSGVNIPGDTEATANINNNNAVSIGANATISAGNDLLLSATSSNVIDYATVTGTNAGLVSLGTDGATANACIDSPGSCNYGGAVGGTSVSVASGDLLTAGVEATLQAREYDSAAASTTSTVAAAIGTNNNTSNVNIIANPVVSVSGASISAPTVTLDSEVDQMLVSSYSDSITAALDSYSNSNSTINVTGDPGVYLAGANISGPVKIAITSLVSSDSNYINTSGQATASINGFTGSIVANSYNNTAYHPTASIDPDTTMTTSDLEINVSAPIVPSGGANPYYSNISNPQNNTVVSWVLTTVQETVKEVVKWLPWPLNDIVKWVTKTVTKWVEQITNSSTTGVAPANFVSSPSLNINGTIYQPAGQNPVLVADSNGSGGVTFTTDTNVPVTTSGNDIIVGDLKNDVTSAINLNAPNGTVVGSFIVHRNTSWTNVAITNNTSDNLVINGIDPAATNGSQPDVNVTAGDASGLSYDFVTDNSTTAIEIQNNSGSNVSLMGFIDNPPGSLSVTNTGGDILGGPDNLSLVNQLTLTANSGSIGSASNYLNAQMESDDSSGATLSAVAGGDLFLNATQVQTVPSGTDLTNYTIPGSLNVDSIEVGGTANLNLGQPLALVDSVTFSASGNTRTVTPEPVSGSYAVGDAVTAGSDVNLTATNAPLYLYGLLQADGTANITDTGDSIYNGGSGQLVQATDINLSAPDGQIGMPAVPINIDLTGGSVNASASGDINLLAPSDNMLVGTIDSALGDVKLFDLSGNIAVGSITASSGTATLFATGSILDADNSSTTDIAAKNILLLADGSIGTDSNALIVQTPSAFNSISGASTNVTQASGDFNVGTVTSAAGNATLTAASGNVILGTVNATQGTATISALGSILDGDAPSSMSDINANSIHLSAAGGTVGTEASPLQINSSYSAAGLVSAAATGDVNLNETAGSLNVGTITSFTGNVNLTAPDGDVNLGKISSISGDTNITALDSILNASGPADTNIIAINVNLTATNGAIGAEGDPLNIDSSNDSPGQLTAWANQSVWITEVNGDLNVKEVTSSQGNVKLGAIAGNVILGTVNATQGTATVDASGSILDGDAPSSTSDINANTINLAAYTGTVGTSANPLQINSSYSAAGLVNGLALGDVNLNETAGSLNVGTIDSITGNVNLTVPDGSANLGTVDALQGTTNITASNSILNAFGSNPGVANINAENINLTATNGSIGTSGTMLTIDSSDASPGVVNALADQSIYLDEVSGPLNVDSIESQTGDIVILSDGSILNAGTSGSHTPGVNLTGNNITLTSTNGSIGTSSTRLVVDNRNPDTVTSGMADGSNYLDMSADGDIYVNETGGNLLSHSISSAAGDIDLLASNGNGDLNQVVGNQNVTVDVTGSLLNISNITGSTAAAQKAASPNNVSLTVETAGGTLNVNHMDVFQSVTTRADNTTLADVVHTNLANPTLDTDIQANALHFDDQAAAGGIANNIDINISPCAACTTAPAVIFDNYLTQTGTVNASVDWLEFINTIVGTSADFQNNWLDVQLTNKFPGKSKGLTPWYLFMIGSHTAQSYHPIEFDRSTFLKKGTQPTYNQSIGNIFNDLLGSYGFRP